MTSVTLSFLGTGSGVPSSDRFFTSCVIHSGETHLLIDAGEPCVHLLCDRGRLIQEIDAVLITHGHVDHIGGVPALLQGCMLRGRSKPLAIHLPEEMIAPLRAWISALYLTEEGLGFPLTWKSWTNAVAEEFAGGVRVTPHANSHLKQSYRPLPGALPNRPCASYSLELEMGEFRGIFSGDLASPGELLPLISKPTTVLVSELSHFSAIQLGGVIRGAPIATLCLVHLSEEYASDRSELQMQMEELLPGIGNVILPDDGEPLDF